MTATLIDGKALATQLRKSLRQKIAQHTQFSGQTPGLAVILVGNDPASEIYVNAKHKACEQVGIHSTITKLPADISQGELVDQITALNNDPSVSGFLVQLPLPAHIDETHILERISPQKDVDGFHAYNLGRLAQRRPCLRPSTPYGIIQLLNHYEIELKGKHVVIVGASNIVGRPMCLEALLAGATTTVCHRFTENLAQHVSQADILIVSIGKPGIIQSEWLKKDSIVIDVGINRLADGSICGDVEFATACERVSMITPVPGGVGPMTVYGLLENTYLAASQYFI